MLSHLEMLGGMLVSPRATIARLLATDEGRLWSVLAWLVVLGVALTPVREGNAVRIARVDLFGGVYLLVNGLADRLVVPFLGVAGAATVLFWVARTTRKPLPLDRALDICGFLLVPYLALASVGVLLSSAGLDLSVLPHHPIQGPTSTVALRVGVAYAGSLILFGWTVLSILALPSEVDEFAAADA